MFWAVIRALAFNGSRHGHEVGRIWWLFVLLVHARRNSAPQAYIMCFAYNIGCIVSFHPEQFLTREDLAELHWLDGLKPCRTYASSVSMQHPATMAAGFASDICSRLPRIRNFCQSCKGSIVRARSWIGHRHPMALRSLLRCPVTSSNGLHVGRTHGVVRCIRCSPSSHGWLRFCSYPLLLRLRILYH